MFTWQDCASCQAALEPCCLRGCNAGITACSKSEQWLRALGWVLRMSEESLVPDEMSIFPAWSRVLTKLKLSLMMVMMMRELRGSLPEGRRHLGDRIAKGPWSGCAPQTEMQGTQTLQSPRLWFLHLLGWHEFMAASAGSPFAPPARICRVLLEG